MIIKQQHERKTLTGTTVLISSSKTPINAMTLSFASYRSTLAIYEEKNSVLNKSWVYYRATFVPQAVQTRWEFATLSFTTFLPQTETVQLQPAWNTDQRVAPVLPTEVKQQTEHKTRKNLNNTSPHSLLAQLRTFFLYPLRAFLIIFHQCQQ